MRRRLLPFLLCLLSCAAAVAAETPFELKDGDRVVFLGDTVVEREQYHGWVELMLTTRFADRAITFRNLGWSADTPAGDSRFGRSLLQAGKEPADEGWTQLVRQIEEAKPTVVFAGYGMANSFEGEAGLARFKSDYARLLDVIEQHSPGARVVLLAPLPHENLGAPFPAPATHNSQLAAYARAVGEIATQRRARFVPLFDLLRTRASEPLTDNGIHPTDRGYRVIAEVLEDQLFGAATPGPWRASTQSETLRQAILRKNEWYFHRSRPANMAYIFGFRKREQGKNATEVLQFDEFIAAEEKRIAQLRGLQLVSVPEIPRRVGNLKLEFTPQPHPEFQVADGLEVTLWAENPMLHKPIQMNFDAKGRLWVVSSELYPQIEPGQAPTDKIIVLEDTKGAGRADKATVFADGLLIPTGIEVGDGGAYVAQSTDLIHFKDTDGDGKADVRRIVLSGFGTEDTHHNLHTLHWGPDGRLYMNQSVYTRTDTETPHGVVRLKAGGVFRFDPRDQRMEILFRGWVNAWGHQFDAYGQSFVTDGAGFQGVSWAIPGATYFTLAPFRRTLESVSPGRYPKFAGLEIVRSTQFPADWQGDVITADFRAHRVVRFKLSDQGSGYVTKEMPDLMRTTADSFRPIDVRLGPDGALYIADWSNPIIQHGEVDFRDTRRDKSHGRIWRVAAKTSAAPMVKRDFSTLGTAALLDALNSANGYEQERAKRMLVERGAAAVEPELDAWTKKQTTESGRLQALWAYQALNLARPDLLNGLLAASDPRVRAAAVRALPPGGEIGPLAKLIADAHPRVRLEAVRALGSRNSAPAAELALSVMERPMDPFLDYALWLTINDLAEPWLAAVKSGAWKFAGREKQLEFALKSIEPTLAAGVLSQLIGRQGVARDGSGPWIELIGAAGGPAELRILFDQVLRGELTGAVALRAFTALGDAARLRSVKPAGEFTAFGDLLATKDAAMRTAAIGLAGTWKLTALTPRLVTLAGDANATAADRTAALAALRDIGGPKVIAELKKLAGAASAPAVRRDAVVTLAALELPTAVPDMVAVLQATTDEAQAQALWRSLLAIRGVSARLATELAKVELPRAVALAGLRPAREGNQHQALVPVLMKAAGLVLSTVQLSATELQALAQEALAKGDAARGEHLYRRAELACVACHAIGGAGGKIGPDLTSIGASAPPDYLVESLLYPSAKIKEGYHSVLISTKDGRELSGMIARESATEVLLRDAANQEVSIPVQSIAKRTSVGSLMPAGLVDTLLPEERLDLFKFLAQLGKPGAFDAAKGGVARAWKLYLILSVNEHLGVQRVVAGDFTLKDWMPALSLTSGDLPREAVALAYPSLNNNRGLFAATQFDSAKGGTATFTLAGNMKGLWVNGALIKPGATVRAAVKPGRNTLVIQLDDAKVDNVRVSSADVAFALE
ncbi:PVC-type heme-binding CxxCH protein [Horticoccus sp. 23ND18S-11]|uniref:PVC-type heme-binding CxxCH protein n=1 Tax=Horticoccus sp. 23ND18S-11 TaxID=3391832 RepID=UPI0039C99CD8